MPQTYALYKTEQCKCQILGTGYHCEVKDMEAGYGLKFLANNQNFYRPLNSKESVTTQYSLLLRIVENVYEKCATYNLKYCPIWGFKIYDSYFSKTMKDFVILACFMIANFVVFITMFTKTVVHMYYVIFVLARWLTRTNKCKCKVLGTRYIAGEANMTSVSLLAQNNSLCRLLNAGKPSALRYKPIFRMVENFYDKCAAYNLKYCPIRGFTKHDGYISHAVMDFIILVCFLVANFVVFVTIIAKTLVHLYYVVFMLLKWVTRPRHDFKEHDFGGRPISLSVTRIAEAFMRMKKDQAAQWNSKEPGLASATKEAPPVTTKVSHRKPAEDGHP